MSRTAVNFLLDCFLLLVLVFLMWTTAVVQFIFPAGTKAVGWTLWGHGFDSWQRVQGIVFAVFLLSVLLHLILHWTWVCGFVAARIGKMQGRHISTNEATRTVYGVAMLAMILTVLGAAVLVAQLMVRAPATG